MTRRLRNLLTVLSLVLCVGVCVLWVRSYSTFDWLKMSELESTVGGGADSYTIVESRAVVSWRGTFGYVRSQDFTAPTPRAVSYSLVLRPSSERDLAQNVDTLFVVSDLERLWNKRAQPIFVAAGFQYVVHDPERTRGGRVIVPYWFAFVLTALAPAAWSCVRRPREKALQPACRSCGYDVRATPDRCPECGTIAAAVSAR